MAARFVLPNADVGNGISPSAGAKLEFFISGTSTQKDTFSDNALTIPNANPVIANGDGVFPDIFLKSDVAYKVTLKDIDDVQVGFREADPVGGKTSGGDVEISGGVENNIVTINATEGIKDSGINFGTTANDAVQLDANAKIPAVDGSQLTLTPISPNSPRNIIQFGTATSVKLRDVIYPMGGFRFWGNYRKTRVPTFTSATQEVSVSTSTDLAFGMSSVVLENWYGVFACADDGDANVTFRVVPFLRVESVAASVVTLRKAGEAIHASAPQTYTWANDALNGAECLVITETIDSRAVAWSGRETTITDSTTTTLTLSSIGTIAAADWLLPAPNVEFDNYRYCGAFYFDTAEVRNMADSGTIVKSRQIFDMSGTNTGAVATFELRQISGYISPLSSAVYFFSQCVLSTASTGNFGESFAIDTSLHDVSRGFYNKTTTGNETVFFGETYIPLMFGPQYAYLNSGTLNAQRINGQQNIYGWIEP